MYKQTLLEKVKVYPDLVTDFFPLIMASVQTITIREKNPSAKDSLSDYYSKRPGFLYSL